MGLRTKLFALTYDHQLAKVEQAGLRARRHDLVADLRGDVLEIGAGTGANLEHYGADVATLALTEPEPAMLRRLHRRSHGDQPPSDRPSSTRRGPAFR